MNWRRLILLTIACGAALTLGARPRKPDSSWWREARFGMFIHLGLYSVAAGEWNGEPVEGIGEWIQNFARIPNDAYAELAADFALQRRAPDAWAEIAERAGARYVVFTAKHHDGFCLYPSDVSDFDIELTPCGYDPVKELIAACRRRGLKVGIYYSHRQDWHEEDAAVMQNEYDGHYGKPKSEVRPDLDCYIREKALPQVRELLGRYGRTIRVPEGLEYDRVPVIRLDFGTRPEISRLNLASEGVIRIPAASGTIVPGEKGRLRIANGGNTEDFNPGTGKLVLTCEVDEPGTYDIDLYTSRHWRRSFAEGTEMTLKFDSGEVFASCPLGLDEELENVRKNSYPEIRSRIGTVVFDRPGTKRMELSVDRLGRYRRLGFFGEDIRNESDDNIRVMRLTLTRRGRN